MKYLILFLLLSFGCAAENCHTDAIKYKEKYSVRVSNWVGACYCNCESYSKEENTYKLFDKDNELVNEITITDGYVVQIDRRGQ